MISLCPYFIFILISFHNGFACSLIAKHPCGENVYNTRTLRYPAVLTVSIASMVFILRPLHNLFCAPYASASGSTCISTPSINVANDKTFRTYIWFEYLLKIICTCFIAKYKGCTLVKALYFLHGKIYTDFVSSFDIYFCKLADSEKVGHLFHLSEMTEWY